MDHLVLQVGLALMLIALAVWLAAKLRISNVPFLIIIGMVVGPHAPQLGPLDFRFIESAPLITFMGRLGVLFLLFYLGLESSVTRLIQAGRSIFTGGTIYIGINFTAGLVFAYLAGFSPIEMLAVAGITTISSSAIVGQDPLRLQAHRESGSGVDTRHHHVRRTCFSQSTCRCCPALF
jgi:CPA2 family monovalent cation:H+ antiporter-2